MRTVAICLGLALSLACTGERTPRREYDVQIGDAHEGERIIRQVGCGACHVIPGVRGADGLVGPPLNWFSRRTYIAGQLPNTPANLVRWISHPRAVEPDTAMPDVGLDEAQATAVAAYLYTLR